jgi:hypothetical protein
MINQGHPNSDVIVFDFKSPTGVPDEGELSLGEIEHDTIGLDFHDHCYVKLRMMKKSSDLLKKSLEDVFFRGLIFEVGQLD